MIGFATGAIVTHRALLAGATPALGNGAVRGGEYPESRRQRQNQAEDLREASHKTPFDRRQAPQTCDWVTNSPPRDRGDKLPAVPPQDRGYLNFITLLTANDMTCLVAGLFQKYVDRRVGNAQFLIGTGLVAAVTGRGATDRFHADDRLRLSERARSLVRLGV